MTDKAQPFTKEERGELVRYAGTIRKPRHPATGDHVLIFSKQAVAMADRVARYEATLAQVEAERGETVRAYNDALAKVKKERDAYKAVVGAFASWVPEANLMGLMANNNQRVPPFSEELEAAIEALAGAGHSWQP